MSKTYNSIRSRLLRAQKTTKRCCKALDDMNSKEMTMDTFVLLRTVYGMQQQLIMLQLDLLDAKSRNKFLEDKVIDLTLRLDAKNL